MKGTMKISKKTLSVLKNFSDINMSVEVKAGNTLRTVSVAKNILAQVEIEESFPREFAIYDVNRFLGAASLFEEPNFEFGEKSVKIGTDKYSLDYVYCDPHMIVTPPENNITVPDPEVRFRLTQGNLSQVLKAGHVLGTPEISVESSGDKMVMKALDVNNDSSDTFTVDLDGQVNGGKFRFVFKIENFKMISADYDVEISSKGIARFSNSTSNTQYWIATETSSTYGG
jgi:hypothetical protein|tara:strand:+ start:35 stop:718 length:684 start_codon:yes stop_codon:yes gene_type:complete